MEPNVIVNDIEKSDDFMLGNLKRWGEHEPFQAEDKYGGFRSIRPNFTGVTSNYHPKELWPNATELEPITRRFKIVKLVFKYYPAGHRNHDPAHIADGLWPQQDKEKQQEAGSDE
jgi:hypothetical protein